MASWAAMASMVELHLGVDGRWAVTSYILALHFFEYAGLFADLVTSYILVPCSVAYIVGRDDVDGRDGVDAAEEREVPAVLLALEATVASPASLVVTAQTGKMA